MNMSECQYEFSWSIRELVNLLRNSWTIMIIENNLMIYAQIHAFISGLIQLDIVAWIRAVF